jgi:hypothetical protein
MVAITLFVLGSLLLFIMFVQLVKGQLNRPQRLPDDEVLRVRL